MNSEKLNRWLTLLANVGVVIGLALLIYELRESQYLAETEAAVRSVINTVGSPSIYKADGRISTLDCPLSCDEIHRPEKK